MFHSETEDREAFRFLCSQFRYIKINSALHFDFSKLLITFAVTNTKLLQNEEDYNCLVSCNLRLYNNICSKTSKGYKSCNTVHRYYPERYKMQIRGRQRQQVLHYTQSQDKEVQGKDKER